MKNRSSWMVVVAISLAVAPHAAAGQDGADAVIEYRQSIMQAFRTHMGGVRAATEGTVPMDHARHHAVAFREMALSLANAFPDGSTSADSRALPVIWTDRDAFIDRVTAIQGATADLVEAAEAGDAMEVGSALQAVQGTCRGCHGDFRGPAS